MAGIAWAFSHLSCEDETLLNAIAKKARPRITDAEPHALAALADALPG